MDRQKNKFTIIVIKDKRRLYSFEVATIFLKVFFFTIIVIGIIALSTLFLYRKTVDPIKTTPIAKTESSVKSSHTAESETKTDSVADTDIAQWHKLSVEDFHADFNLVTGELHYRFLLKNVNQKNVTTSGYIFIILKSEGMATQYWLTHPNVALKSGFPQNFKDGDPFSITNYKEITKTIHIKNRYDTASVIVFSNEGVLVLKENFDLKG